MTDARRFDALVVGAGVNGLAAARHLALLGAGRIGLVERFRIGHDRGSSHGTSRITRSSYGVEAYVDLVRVAHEEEWPRLERDGGRRLLHPTPGCFFGPRGRLYDAFTAARERSRAPVDLLDVETARRRFPMFRFGGCAGVLHDRSAALVAAADTIRTLEELVRAAGVEVLEETRVDSIDPGHEPIRLATDRGPLETDALVVCAGGRTADLLPFLAPRLSVVRQTVGYFRVEAEPEALAPGRFPVWAWLGDGENDMWYGLPEFGRPGLKAARHVTSAPHEDADAPPDPGSAERAAEELTVFVRGVFTVPVRERLAVETCLYTNTRSEDFVLDRHPSHPRIAIGAGFSGHGFKFAPVTGRILAELALRGRTTLPAFERHRALFSLNCG